mmetsp:Transcript_107965/g.170565  ORF Transcript_107965/g.170565 Transcript_107965/m.170565 type:complete len:373 (-) Transcript_107965:196-1314(-)
MKSQPLTQDDDYEDEEEDDEVEDEDEESPYSRQNILVDSTIVGTWLCLLVMILLMEIVSYQKVSEGDLDLKWRIQLAGIVGLVCTLIIVCLAKKLSCAFLICGSCCGMMFAAAFITFWFLPLAPASSLIRIDTVLSIQSNCTDNNYVAVSELLTYSVDPAKVSSGTVAKVERNVLRQFAPTGFVVEGSGVIQNATILNHRFVADALNSMKDPMSRKTVNIAFDNIDVQGSMPVEISLRLNYTARLADCKVSPGPQCGVWIVPGSRSADIVSTFSLSGGSAKTTKPGEYEITSDVPGLELGTQACPFAAKSTDHSWIWFVGGGLIMLGLCLTTPLGHEDGARECIVPVVIGLVLVVIGGGVCVAAYMMDIPRV